MWLFDTYSGIPEPSPRDPDHPIAKRYTGMFGASLEEVRRSLDFLGIGSNVRLVLGLFQDTLPLSPIRSISLLHIDGDWYQSVRVCLETMYDRVSPGGIIQFDDYGIGRVHVKPLTSSRSKPHSRANRWRKLTRTPDYKS